MAKKSVKIALTYVITLVVAFAVIGGSGFYFMNRFVSGDKDKDSGKNTDGTSDSVVTGSLAVQTKYVPAAEDSQTLLFIYDAEKRQTASCFLLVRFLPADGKLILVPVQSDMCADVDGTKNSVYEFYRTGGSKQAVKAIENAAGITVDKYMKLDTKSFTVFIDLFGGAEYNVPYNFIYENPTGGEDTIIRQGTENLDSDSLRKVLTFPNFKKGEEERARVLGTTITDMLNANISTSLKSNLDSFFTTVINSSVETDITSYDFEDKKEAMKYIIDPEKPDIVTLVLPSGKYNESGLYVPDANFLKSLKVWFGIAE